MSLHLLFLTGTSATCQQCTSKLRSKDGHAKCWGRHSGLPPYTMAATDTTGTPGQTTFLNCLPYFHVALHPHFPKQHHPPVDKPQKLQTTTLQCVFPVSLLPFILISLSNINLTHLWASHRSCRQPHYSASSLFPCCHSSSFPLASSPTCRQTGSNKPGGS
jgi:hypothetical protein